MLRIPNNHTSVLQREDVSCVSSNGNSGVQLILRNYKHNREKSPVIILLSRNPGSKLCPVNALVQYLAVFQHKTDPLFQFTDGKAVPASYISKQLHKIFEFLGLNTNYYKDHSFRIGAATHAANLGFSENYIQKLGRWNSNAIRRYIRIDAFRI